MNLFSPSSSARGRSVLARRAVFTLAALLVLNSLLFGAAFGAPLSQADSPQGPGRIWTQERVDAPQAFTNMTDRSLRIDANNNPRLAYGGDHLYYALYNGSTWVITTVDASFGVGQYASLALDRNGNPHIAYYDAHNGALKYARFNGSQWIVQTVAGGSAASPASAPESPEVAPEGTDAEPVLPDIDPSRWDSGLDRTWQDPLLRTDAGASLELLQAAGPGVGQYTSIAVDSDGRAHISFFDATNQDLVYASDTSSGWRIETLDGGGRRPAKVGKYTSLALDAGGDAHISYFDESFDRLKYIRQSDGEWEIPEIVEESDGENVVGAYTSLALDGSGRPRISYLVLNVTNDEGELKYASRASGQWQTTVIDDADDTGYYSSLAIDSSGQAHISYYNNTRGDLKYWNSSDDNPAAIASSGNVGLYSSLAVDRNNLPHISYLDVDNGLVNEIFWRNGAWATRSIAALRDVGLSSSLILDSAGRPHISYFNDTTDDLKYATRSGTAWQPTPASEPGSVGIYNGIGLNTAGQPGIAFYDATNKALKYATCSGVTCSVQGAAIDQATNVDLGQYVSLVIDNQNYPSVAYYDATNQDLKYAWDPNPSDPNNAWQKWAMDSAGDVGKYTSIAVDSSRRFYIAYYDATNKLLKYANFNTVWTTGVVQGWSGVLRDTSVAIDAAGNPHISFYDVANGDLKYATLSGGAWTVQTLDSGGDVGQFSSIEVSSAGAVFISYYDATNGDLRLVELASGVVLRELVDSIGQVGLYTSLALDASGIPHISYYDASNGDLKYAYGVAAATRIFLPLILRGVSVP